MGDGYKILAAVLHGRDSLTEAYSGVAYFMPLSLHLWAAAKKAVPFKTAMPQIFDWR
jgi:hypothetical protein